MKSKKISWQQEKLKDDSVWQLLGKALLAAVVSALLIWAAVTIYLDAFPIPAEAEGKPYLWYLLLGTLPFLAWNEGIGYLGKKKLRLWGNAGLLLCFFLVLLFAYREVLSELLEGMNAVAATYLRTWNTHYGAGVSIPVGNSDYQKLAAEFILAVVVCLLQLCSALFRKRAIMLLLPIGTLSLELLVGLSPGWPGLAVLFVGLILALFLDSNPVFDYKRAGVLIVSGILIVLVSGKVFGGVADKVYVYHDRLIRFQRKLEATVKNINLKQWVSDLAYFGEDDVIDNSSPQFEEKEVLRITMSEIPHGTVYLRGYHCNNYKEGRWVQNRDAFQNVYNKLDMSEEAAAELLLQLRHEVVEASLNKEMTYEVQYTVLRSKTAFLPYGVKPDATSYDLMSDYVVKKALSKEKTTDKGWTLPHYGAAVGNVKALEPKAQNFFREYGAYVQEQYLEVPEHMERVKAIALNIRNNNDEQVKNLYTTHNTADKVNRARMALAEIVAQRLESTATYSQELDKLPSGEDAVEYFLITGKKGYCIHFASAGTLILRELGIPARYVCGYVVKSDSLTKSGSGYTASILDSYAHAWTEVYLENYGWVPVEMTPGYSQLTFSEPEEVPESTEDSSESEESKETQAAEESSEPDGEKVSEEEAKEQEEPKAQEDEDSSTGKPGGYFPSIGENDEQSLSHGSGTGDDTKAVAGDGPKGSDGKMSLLEWFTVTVRKALWVLLLGSLCMGVFFCIRKRSKSKKQRLLNLISKGRTRTAVKQINRHVYHCLIWRKRKLPRKHTDEAYRERLQEAFPEVGKQAWSRYFDIVRRATYSRETVTMEEAKECYKVYLEVKGDLKALR